MNDLSPQAVSTRLKRASQLRKLCLALAGPRRKRPWGVPTPAASSSEVKEQSAADGNQSGQPTSGNVPTTATNLPTK